MQQAVVAGKIGRRLRPSGATKIIGRRAYDPIHDCNFLLDHGRAHGRRETQHHVEAALGSLTLQSPDPAKRVQAAQSVFKTHDEAMLPGIDGALATETNKAAKLAFTEASAAILLFKEDATDSEKLEAIATIKARGDQEALALLTGLSGDQPPAVARAAANATSAIQSNLALWSMAQNAWYGLSLGSVLLLAAIGLAITFSILDVVNFAQGSLVMWGAYLGVLLAVTRSGWVTWA